jgi:putative peptide maturation dehydrogenase
VLKVRRTRYAFFYLEDAVLELLRGASAPKAYVVALALLTGERLQLDGEQLELLLSIPEWWVDEDEAHAEAIRKLAHQGLLVTDADDGRLAGLRRRDEALSRNAWNRDAALYHYMTQWRGRDIRDDDEELELGPEARTAALAFVAEHGPPPSAFHERWGPPTHSLPDGRRDGELYRTLMTRRTTRAFDQDTEMTAEDLATVLRYVFGCHGSARNIADVVCIKRTSPSGGALHPVEAYPIVSNVRDVEPGIYHFDGRDHALTLLEPLAADEARRTATTFMCGQSYFGRAHVSCVLTARFYRNHWKYRRHDKAYTGILMDAGHLSQTLYLVSTDLGLGAFVTVAINSLDIEERLGLDGAEEGVVAIVGCGPRAAGGSPLELSFTPA